MKHSEVQVGATYVAKVSGKLANVRIVSDLGTSMRTVYGQPNRDREIHCGWGAINLATKHQIHIRSAARLRQKVDTVGLYPPPCELDGMPASWGQAFDAACGVLGHVEYRTVNATTGKVTTGDDVAAAWRIAATKGIPFPEQSEQGRLACLAQAVERRELLVADPTEFRRRFGDPTVAGSGYGI